LPGMDRTANFPLVKTALRGAFLLLLLALFSAAASYVTLPTREDILLPFEITIKDAALASSDLVWVDARSSDYFERGHVTGALLLNDENWDAMLGSVFEAWQPSKVLVVYCDAGCSASHKVAERLREIGMDPVYVLKGGYDAWEKSPLAK
jgi:rhodanese-related sulfurtransferase